MAKCWHVRICMVPLQGPKETYSTTYHEDLDDANKAFKSAQGQVRAMNRDTRRRATYYVEPLFHACI